LNEKELNALGYPLIRDRHFTDAERILQLNVDQYSESANTYDSLAEAHMDDGKTTDAIANYDRSLELNRDTGQSRLSRNYAGSDEARSRSGFACDATAALAPQRVFGAGYRIRTDDLPLTRRLLYQLS
jgi:tetratricopeptide (TPR) repeat protein